MPFEVLSALIGLSGAVIGGAISSVTTLLISRSERRKFRDERSWDLRREAYTIIIGALDRGRAILGHIDRNYREDPHGYDQSDAWQQATKQMIEHLQLARTAFHAHRLVLSKTFVAKYDQLNAELDSARGHDPLPPEKASAAAEIATRIVGEMETLARRELGVEA